MLIVVQARNIGIASRGNGAIHMCWAETDLTLGAEQLPSFPDPRLVYNQYVSQL